MEAPPKQLDQTELQKRQTNLSRATPAFFGISLWDMAALGYAFLNVYFLSLIPSSKREGGNKAVEDQMEAGFAFADEWVKRRNWRHKNIRYKSNAIIDELTYEFIHIKK